MQRESGDDKFLDVSTNSKNVSEIVTTLKNRTEVVNCTLSFQSTIKNLTKIVPQGTIKKKT